MCIIAMVNLVGLVFPAVEVAPQVLMWPELVCIIDIKTELLGSYVGAPDDLDI